MPKRHRSCALLGAALACVSLSAACEVCEDSEYFATTHSLDAVTMVGDRLSVLSTRWEELDTERPVRTDLVSVVGADGTVGPLVTLSGPSEQPDRATPQRLLVSGTSTALSVQFDQPGWPQPGTLSVMILTGTTQQGPAQVLSTAVQAFDIAFDGTSYQVAWLEVTDAGASMWLRSVDELGGVGSPIELGTSTPSLPRDARVRVIPTGDRRVVVSLASRFIPPDSGGHVQLVAVRDGVLETSPPLVTWPPPSVRGGCRIQDPQTALLGGLVTVFHCGDDPNPVFADQWDPAQLVNPPMRTGLALEADPETHKYLDMRVMGIAGDHVVVSHAGGTERLWADFSATAFVLAEGVSEHARLAGSGPWVALSAGGIAVFDGDGNTSLDLRGWAGNEDPYTRTSCRSSGIH